MVFLSNRHRVAVTAVALASLQRQASKWSKLDFDRVERGEVATRSLVRSMRLLLDVGVVSLPRLSMTHTPLCAIY